MITHPTRSDLTLWEVVNAGQAPPPVRAIFHWAATYLSRPHPDLGRPGPMCPYVPSALRSRLMWVAMQPGVPGDPAEVAATVRAFRQWLPELEPRTGPEADTKTLLVLFPDLPEAAIPGLIDGTQALLKPEFVADGLMIGQFHPIPPDQPGLWNPDFRPLRSPVPLLAIRAMVPSDLPFLADNRGFFTAYSQRFGDAVPARCREQYDAALARFGLAPVSAALTGIRHVVHWHHALGPVRSPQDVGEALRIEVARITKTLLVEEPDGRPLRVVAGVADRIDLKRLATVLGRRRLRVAAPDRLLALLGQPAGGVSPLGAPQVPVVLDANLLRYASVLVGGGAVGIEVELSPHDLLRACQGYIAAVSGLSGPLPSAPLTA